MTANVNLKLDIPRGIWEAKEGLSQYDVSIVLRQPLFRFRS